MGGVDHEVSLDWLILGDPRSMICILAGAEALPRACTRKSGSMSASVQKRPNSRDAAK